MGMGRVGPLVGLNLVSNNSRKKYASMCSLSLDKPDPPSSSFSWVILGVGCNFVGMGRSDLIDIYNGTHHLCECVFYLF